MDKDNAQANIAGYGLEGVPDSLRCRKGAIAAKRRAEILAAKEKADEAQAMKFATELYMNAQKLQNDAEMQYASKHTTRQRNRVPLSNCT